MSFDNSSGGGDTTEGGEFMLFGVRVRVDPMRKSVSLNDLSQYELPQESSNAADVPAAGYASADDAVAVGNQGFGSRERKRGVPWTEEEHKLFLLGLQKVGKGDWRGISRNFVKTRTPTQVASHAQKYFLRRSNLSRRRRRSSLFDITTDTITAIPMEEENHQEHKAQPLPTPAQVPLSETSVIGQHQVLPFPMTICPIALPVHIDNPMRNLNLGHVGHVNYDGIELVNPVHVLPSPTQTRMVDLNLNQRLMDDSSPLSLNLSLSLDQVPDQFSRHLSSFHHGDSMISVA